jgi:hypothetical protein
MIMEEIFNIEETITVYTADQAGQYCAPYFLNLTKADI